MKIGKIILGVTLAGTFGGSAILVSDSIQQEEVQDVGMDYGTEQQTQENDATEKEDSDLNISEENVEIEGITEEHDLYFIADTHITDCDERDEYLEEKANQRSELFQGPNNKKPVDILKEFVNETNEESGDLAILGGDIIDSAMYESIDEVKDTVDELECPYVYLTGNHDFEYGSEYFTETARQDYLPRLANLTDTTKDYQVVEYDDMVVFAVDDDNNQISQEVLDVTDDVLSKQKPVVLALHVPIEPQMENTLLQDSINMWGGDQNGHSRVLLGPEACVPNETTQKFLDLVLDELSPVKLVLAGHIHFYHKDELTSNITQIVTGAGFQGDALHVTITGDK